MAFDDEQLRNAETIINVGRGMGMSNRDIIIGLMTAMQESGLRNLDYGDRDSLGLFQQRPSQGWGTPDQVTDPRYAAGKFFERLKALDGRNDMELWQAAQTVQVSAFPRAYAKWESEAKQVFGRLGGRFRLDPSQLPGWFSDAEPTIRLRDEPGYGLDENLLADAMDKILNDGLADDEELAPGADAVTAPGAEATGSPGAQSTDEPVELPALDTISPEQWEQFMGGRGDGAVTGRRSLVINIAKKFLGSPYVFGAAGPSAFDCSGLLEYTFGKAGIDLPRLAYQQARYGDQVSVDAIRPGDLVFWGESDRTQGNHIALYLGGGRILEAPKPGLSVRIRRLGDEGAVGIRLDY